MKIKLFSSPPASLAFISPEVTALANFALDFWRLNKRIDKISSKIDKDDYKPIKYSLEGCSRRLAELGIEIKEYTSIEYKSTSNLDVITYESDKKIKGEAIVKETVEPAVIYKNYLIKRAKVVVVTPSK